MNKHTVKPTIAAVPIPVFSAWLKVMELSFSFLAIKVAKGMASATTISSLRLV